MEWVFKLYLIFRKVPGNPHWMTFGNVKFHLLIGLPLCEAVQVILQDLVINGGFYIPIQSTIISKETNRWPNIFREIIYKNENKTDPWGTPDRTGTRSEAWSSNTTFWERSESHERIHLWVEPLIPQYSTIAYRVLPCQRPLRNPWWSHRSFSDHDLEHDLSCLPNHGRTGPAGFRKTSDFGNHADSQQECFQRLGACLCC